MPSDEGCGQGNRRESEDARISPTARRKFLAEAEKRRFWEAQTVKALHIPQKGYRMGVTVSPRSKECKMRKSLIWFVARAAVAGGLREW